jgi:ubiquinone/menaquinone biosynthesis C-methylase UbiE
VSLWGRIFAAGYDRVLAPTESAGLGAERERVLASAHGSVVEVGAGTGVNLAHYPPGVRELVVTEPEEPMARRLRARVSALGIRARVVNARAERLPFADGSFDCAVSTLTLCTADDHVAALHELHRVLRPGGALLFIEHVRSSDDEALARMQDRVAPLWRRFGHGCRCNRRTLEAIEAAPFDVRELVRGRLPKAAKPVRPYVSGRALAR